VVPCLHGATAYDSEVERDLSARTIPCDDACASAARTRALSGVSLKPSVASVAGSRLSVLQKPGNLGYCPYSDALLQYARENSSFVEKTESVIRQFLLDSQEKENAHIDLAAMPKAQRMFVHVLATLYGLLTDSFGTEHKRHVRLSKKPAFGHVAPAASSELASSSSAFQHVQNIQPITSLLPNSSVVVMPSMTLTDALLLYGSKVLSMSGASVGHVPYAPRFGDRHPHEPMRSELPDSDRDKKILLFGAKKMLNYKSLLAELLGVTSNYSVQKLDDSNVLITFESPGKANLAIENIQINAQRGVGNFQVRLWGWKE
jgi:hypothetical protein